MAECKELVEWRGEKEKNPETTMTITLNFPSSANIDFADIVNFADLASPVRIPKQWVENESNGSRLKPYSVVRVWFPKNDTYLEQRQYFKAEDPPASIKRARRVRAGQAWDFIRGLTITNYFEYSSEEIDKCYVRDVCGLDIARGKAISQYTHLCFVYDFFRVQ